MPADRAAKPAGVSRESVFAVTCHLVYVHWVASCTRLSPEPYNDRRGGALPGKGRRCGEGSGCARGMDPDGAESLVTGWYANCPTGGEMRRADRGQNGPVREYRRTPRLR